MARRKIKVLLRDINRCLKELFSVVFDDVFIFLNFLESPLSENPARLAGIFPRKGAIQIGSDADFTVVDMNAEKTIKEEDVISKEEFTPWEGYAAKEIPVYTGSTRQVSRWIMER